MAERWQQWMPHDIDSWQGSANVQALSDLAYRAVHNLILDMWKQPDCALPDDDRELAKRSRVAARWNECREEVREYFADRTDAGKITHRVTLKKWNEAREVYEKRQSAAKKTNESRSAYGDRNGDRNAQPTVTERTPSRPADTGTSTSTETSTETKGKTKAKSAASAFVLPDWIDSGVWHGYEEMRCKIRKPMTDDARRLVVKKLAVFDGNGSDPMAVLNQSIENSWQGIFELKQPGGNANGNGNYKSKTESSIDAACEAIRIINARGADCDGVDEARYTPPGQAGYGGLPRLGSGSGLF